jgi:putative ABC transport system ATP-binding protein
VIELQDISRSYVDGERTIHALSGLSLQVPKGQRVAVVGRSGSGKSTLLHLIGGLEWPSAGRLTVGGVRLEGLSESAKTDFRLRTIGFVFQFFHLLPALTVLENLMLPAELAGWRRNAARAKALALLDQMGLAARAGSFPDRLSGGEQQRVAIARALMLDPPILLADEPTGNLDSATGAQVIELIWGLAVSHGLTVVLATHSDALANQADRRLELHDGRIVADSLQQASAPKAHVIGAGG